MTVDVPSPEQVEQIRTRWFTGHPEPYAVVPAAEAVRDLAALLTALDQATTERGYERHRAEHAERRCWAEHPTNTTVVPCILTRRHGGDHWSSTGCAGSGIGWPDPVATVTAERDMARADLAEVGDRLAALFRADEMNPLQLVEYARVAFETNEHAARENGRMFGDAQAALNRGRELHHEITSGPDSGFCSGCEDPHPCATARALSGPVGTPEPAPKKLTSHEREVLEAWGGDTGRRRRS